MINKTLDKPSTRAVTEVQFRANSGQMRLRFLDITMTAVLGPVPATLPLNGIAVLPEC
jgi:hypothetical protein